jgi:hypothetical protein
VKLAARISGVDAPRRIVRLEDELAATLLDTASEALDREAGRAREAAGLSQPLVREGTARRRLIGSRDPAAVARELGTLDEPPAPWLAPVLPAARATLRAAVAARVRDVVATHAGKRKQAAVARTFSRHRK